MRVLIVEDDAMTRAILARVVSSVSGVAALACSSVMEARFLLEVATPDVAIIDLQLGDGLGFEVLQMLDRQGGVALAIIASAYIGQYAQPLQASAGPRLQYMEKPIDYGKLRALLEVMMPDAELFHGPFSPAEYVQIAGAGSHSVDLTCFDSTGVRLGAVVLHRGRIWSAETSESTGMDALRELVLRSDVRVRVLSLKEPTGAPNVDRDWQDAVIDCFGSAHPADDVRALDSLFASGPPPPAVDAKLERDRRAPSWGDGGPRESVAELTAVALRAILRGDYQGALAALGRALELDPDNARVRHQLGRLRNLTEKR